MRRWDIGRWGVAVAGTLALGWAMMTVIEPLLPSFNPNGRPPGPSFKPLYFVPAALAALGAYSFRQGRNWLATSLTALPALGCLLFLPFAIFLLIGMVVLG